MCGFFLCCGFGYAHALINYGAALLKKFNIIKAALDVIAQELRCSRKFGSFLFFERVVIFFRV